MANPDHSIAKLAKEKVRLAPTQHHRTINLSQSGLAHPSGKYSIQSQGLCYCKILVFARNGF
jgi:hypothetical protein